MDMADKLIGHVTMVSFDQSEATILQIWVLGGRMAWEQG